MKRIRSMYIPPGPDWKWARKLWCEEVTWSSTGFSYGLRDFLQQLQGVG